MLDDRDWSKSARVAMTADDDSCTARGVELESELENLRALALALYAGIKLSPKLLEVRRRLIDERYAKRAAEAAEEFAARWKTAQRADGAIVRCRLCGFETFPFDHATIEKHWQTCGPEVLPGAAEAAEEFAARWKTAQRADGAIVRCRLCGFEALPLDHVTIEKHMQACRPEVLPGDQRS
jgi:ribosomal protein S27E